MKKFKNLPVWWENVYKVNQASHVSDKCCVGPERFPVAMSTTVLALPIKYKLLFIVMAKTSLNIKWEENVKSLHSFQVHCKKTFI